jgi:hypothetical protein
MLKDFKTFILRGNVVASPSASRSAPRCTATIGT